MSEFQLYEFMSCDRALTQADKKALQEVSSRVEISSNKATFLYNYGDFRGKPQDVLVRHFDAMYYIANWGTMELYFRFPKGSIDRKVFAPYYRHDDLELVEAGKSEVLKIFYNLEDGYFLCDRAYYLDDLIELRQALLDKDYRVLYLAWLRSIQTYSEDTEKANLEPPVPPGLNDLSSELEAFIEIFELDPFLVKTSASISGTQEKISDSTIKKAISQLPRSECDRFLFDLLNHKSGLAINLKQKITPFLPQVQESTPPQRTIETLLAKAADYQKEREKQDKAAQKAQKIRELEILIPRKAELWQFVESAIACKTAYSYDEAIAQLIELRELAEYQNQLSAFHKKIGELCDRHSKKSALIKRIQKAKLRF
ncbi:MAG: hypothetical protein SAJ12_20080 [Jaaginema sp. PMC 1079.18]|nr:hypothetical protein [Jaaginema sp. PMC 1080.18]MEC4853286.1 hypothetical protein [Jaaginema sp. PMC 1079.18]MEC4868514.1 hypothetical protein [Jaaginema sp. PMC 1078.18]